MEMIHVVKYARIRQNEQIISTAILFIYLLLSYLIVTYGLLIFICIKSMGVQQKSCKVCKLMNKKYTVLFLTSWLYELSNTRKYECENISMYINRIHHSIDDQQWNINVNILECNKSRLRNLKKNYLRWCITRKQK